MPARRWLVRLIRLALVALLVGPPAAALGAACGWDRTVMLAAVWLVVGVAVAAGRGPGWDAASRFGRRLSVGAVYFLVLVFLAAPAARWGAAGFALYGGMLGVMLLVYGSLIDYLADAGRDIEAAAEEEPCSTSRSGSPRSPRTPATWPASAPPPAPGSTSSAGSGSGSTTAA